MSVVERDKVGIVLPFSGLADVADVADAELQLFLT